MDLRLEAKNLERFRKNFSDEEHVIFPQPLHPFVAKHVLVETYEVGQHMSSCIEEKCISMEKRKHLADMGVNILLKMVL